MPLTESDLKLLTSLPLEDNPLYQHARDDLRLTGLVNVKVDVDQGESFRCDDDLFVSWTLSGNHGTRVAVPGDHVDPSEKFLGWAPTGQQVKVRLFTVGKATLGDNDVIAAIGRLRSRYDRMQPLAQIGVQAIGRPVTAGGRSRPVSW